MENLKDLCAMDRVRIGKKHLTPLPNGFDFEGKGVCGVCGKEFSFIINGVLQALYHPLPKICENKECETIFYIKKKQCKNCEKEFEYDSRISGDMSIFCSDKCEEENKEKIEKYRKEKIEKEIEKDINDILPPKYIGIKSDKNIKSFMNKSLYIFGSTGNGKSVFMANLAIEYIKKRVDVKWISTTRFIMELQSSYRNDGNPFEEAADVAEFKGILCLDDLGACKTTEYVEQIIYYIFNHREEYKLPTLITSNYPLSKIDNIIGSRVSSRIAGICEIIKFEGEDKRLKIKNSEINIEELKEKNRKKEREMH